MLHKSFGVAELKADGESGTFEALVSVFNNVDGVGDRILPGAYTKTLAKWQESGDPLPVILSHQWKDPMAHIGVIHPGDAVETPAGLFVKGHLDIQDNPVARQVHKLMQRRSLKEFSIGYSVPQGGEQRQKNGVNEINAIDLFECGPCLKGVNGATELGAVKSLLDLDSVSPEPIGTSEPQDRDDQPVVARALDPEEIRLLKASRAIQLSQLMGDVR